MIGRLIHARLGRRAYMRYEALRQFWLYGPRLQKDPQQRFLERFVRRGDYCLDVGANLGVYALQLTRLVGRAGRVDAFEPLPATFAGLQLTARLVGRGQLFCHRQGIGERAARVAMTTPIHDGLPAHGRSRLDDRPVDHDTRTTRVDVDVTTIDAFAAAAGLPRLDFIKLDIEGAELPALRGAAGVLARKRPTLLLEVDPAHTADFGYRPVDLFRFLARAGYERAFYVAGGRLRAWPKTPGGFPVADTAPLPADNFFLVHAARPGLPLEQA